MRNCPDCTIPCMKCDQEVEAFEWNKQGGLCHSCFAIRHNLLPALIKGQLQPTKHCN